MIETVDTVLTAVALCASLWLARGRARERSEARLARLERAATLLEEHASALARFLEAPEAADELKRLLVEVSDVATDRAAMRRLTAPGGTRAAEAAADDPEVRALNDALARLQVVRPDLDDDFWVALHAAAAAARLRWPDAADVDESLSPPTAASRRRQMTMAVAAAHLRVAPLGRQPPAGVMA